VLGLLDVSFARGGLVSTDKIYERFRNPRTDIPIEQLPRTFAAVATDLATGHEVWLRQGPLLDALRAAAAMPGLFPAVRHEDCWLVDGGLVNPVPVSLCRALGATVVIAVNLNGALETLPRLTRTAMGRTPPSDDAPAEEAAAGPVPMMALLSQRLGALMGERSRRFAGPFLAPKPAVPNMLEILVGSIDIMQDRITRSRLAGDPPDVIVAPRLGHIGILDFDRSDEMIQLGRFATEAMLPAIRFALRRGG
jgi:NTE family protein